MDARQGHGLTAEFLGSVGEDGAPARPAWTERGTPAYRRISAALFLAGFATFSLLYCVQPLLPAFTEDFGVSPAESSLALALSTGLLALAILAAGALSQAVGRRGLMFASLCGAALCNIAAGLAPGWHGLLIARALEGLALGGVPAVAMAYLAEEIHPRSLGLAMGLYVAGNAFGGMIGRVGIGALTELTSWRMALIVLGGLGLAAALGFIALLPASRNFAPRPGFDPKYHLRAWGGHLAHGGLPLLFLIGFLAMGAFVTVYNYAGFRLTAPPYGLGETAISLIFTVYLFGIAASSAAGALADRLGRGPVLMAGTLVAAAGVALTLAHALAGVIAGIVVLTIGFFMTHAVASGWVGRMAATAKGHAASLYLLAYYLGSSVMGSVGGWFWSGGGWWAVAAFAGAMLAAALAAAVRLRGIERGAERRTDRVTVSSKEP
ncbi:YNFM family putative membrane transporter [Labrys wisconsinensis]|uniref:YNFM family putative membrane transporter n=2 Tax=Labrys wisconsinensis TaxID=425677 RepID=A0ABU0JGE5_9HYPH|nr:MFS transporter [Labrys wisconsinensis]MDQ0473361.1 YNFM family putative membrane transporter [Labrys wisconsinensis]